MKAEQTLFAYSYLFASMLSGIAAFAGYKSRNFNRKFRYLYWYPLVSFIQNIIVLLTTSISFLKGNMHIYIIASIYMFLMVEFIVLCDFFQQILFSQKMKRLMAIILYFYLPVIFVCWLQKIDTYTTLHTLYIVQAVIILIPALTYFFELLKYPKLTDLRHESSFWISTGVIFFFSCTLPLFFMKDIVFNTRGAGSEFGLLSINQLCYGILYLLMLKGYRCRKKEVQS